MGTVRFVMFFLAMLLIADSIAADGSEALERKVRLPKAKATVYALLGMLSEQSGYLFIYDSKVVDNDAVVRVRRKECTLKQAIYEITGNRELELRVLGQHILLSRVAGSAAVKDTASRALSLPKHVAVIGRLLDKETGEPVAGASIHVQGTSSGNVTNRNGEFRLQLPDSLRDRSLSFSHLGYVRQTVEIRALEGRNNTLCLEPKVIPLQEVLIRLTDPKKLLRDMIEHRERNYASPPVYLTAFYREGVWLKKKFQNFTEAVFKIYKTSFPETISRDQVKLLKMSKIENREQTDSIIAKIRSGVEACLRLDLMKDLPDFLSPDAGGGLYTYTAGDVVSVDDRTAHVVCFEQKKGVKEPLFCGELYIDSENSALLRARFEIQPRYVKAATPIFVMRQSQDVRLTTEKIVYTVSYKPWNGIYYIHHIRGDLFFKMKRKRLSFSNPTLHTWFEMVNCRIENENVTRFPRAERLPVHTVFAETDFRYDSDFWGDFNVIPPEEELEKLIEKVSLKIERTTGQGS